jgi:hypothetical protein
MRSFFTYSFSISPVSLSISFKESSRVLARTHCPSLVKLTEDTASAKHKKLIPITLIQRPNLKSCLDSEISFLYVLVILYIFTCSEQTECFSTNKTVSNTSVVEAKSNLMIDLHTPCKLGSSSERYKWILFFISSKKSETSRNLSMASQSTVTFYKYLLKVYIEFLQLNVNS